MVTSVPNPAAGVRKSSTHLSLFNSHFASPVAIVLLLLAVLAAGLGAVLATVVPSVTPLYSLRHVCCSLVTFFNPEVTPSPRDKAANNPAFSTSSDSSSDRRSDTCGGGHCRGCPCGDGAVFHAFGIPRQAGGVMLLHICTQLHHHGFERDTECNLIFVNPLETPVNQSINQWCIGSKEGYFVFFANAIAPHI